jgi:hypothetical protein
MSKHSNAISEPSQRIGIKNNSLGRIIAGNSQVNFISAHVFILEER